MWPREKQGINLGRRLKRERDRHPQASPSLGSNGEKQESWWHRPEAAGSSPGSSRDDDEEEEDGHQMQQGRVKRGL